MKFLLDPLKWLFGKIFDKKTPLSRVIIALIFVMFLIASGLAYILITDEEEIRIETAKEKVERN